MQRIIHPLDREARELLGIETLSSGEHEELVALGMLTATGEVLAPLLPRDPPARVGRSAVSAYKVLNEAWEYGSAFPRGLRIELGNYTLLLISGTASINEQGGTVYGGDIRAQCWRTYRNISTLLQAEGATWRDVVKTTCYLRDIERDYEEFNRVRTSFFDWLGLRPLPASVGVQARLCRENLLVEIEAVAVLGRDG